MSNTPRILVAGIGNIFLGDDAFGVEVVKRLAAQALPRPWGWDVVDFGIRGLDLTYALLDGYDAGDHGRCRAPRSAAGDAVPSSPRRRRCTRTIRSMRLWKSTAWIP